MNNYYGRYNLDDEFDREEFHNYLKEKKQLDYNNTIDGEEKIKLYRELFRKQEKYFYDKERREIEKQKEIEKAVKEAIESKKNEEALKEATEKAIADIFSGFTKDIKINL